MGKKKNKHMNEVETNESYEMTTNHNTSGSGRGDYPVQYPPVAYSMNPYYPPRLSINPHVRVKTVKNI